MTALSICVATFSTMRSLEHMILFSYNLFPIFRHEKQSLIGEKVMRAPARLHVKVQQRSHCPLLFRFSEIIRFDIIVRDVSTRQGGLPNRHKNISGGEGHALETGLLGADIVKTCILATGIRETSNLCLETILLSPMLCTRDLTEYSLICSIEIACTGDPRRLFQKQLSLPFRFDYDMAGFEQLLRGEAI